MLRSSPAQVTKGGLKSLAFEERSWYGKTSRLYCARQVVQAQARRFQSKAVSRSRRPFRESKVMQKQFRPDVTAARVSHRRARLRAVLFALPAEQNFEATDSKRAKFNPGSLYSSSMLRRQFNDCY